ncbi:hypothetical protein L6R53_15130, partial [Myxococcota bacterium]|nr:hypothetical protein [Myxococcota bacterium]
SWLGLPPVVSAEAAEAGKDAAGLPIPAFTFGVNTVAFGTEERFGTTTDLVEDLERLGVTVARHPGGAQLFLEHLLPVSDDPALATVAPRGRLLPITPDEMDEDVLFTLVNGSPGMRVLSQVVRTLATRGSALKLYITLFDLGAGGGTPWGQGSFEGMAGPPVRGLHTNPIGVAWEGHEGQSVEDDLLGRSVAFETGRPGLAGDWDNYTLDPSSPYKRVFFRMLAGAVGRWLSENDSEELPLRVHIAGIEIGNEIDVLHTRMSTDRARVYPDGVSWGRFYYYCASRLRERCGWVPIYLPALSSYTDVGEKYASWGEKLEFVRSMVREIQKGCMAYGGDASDLVAGIDLHFYHYTVQDAAPLLLIWTDTLLLRQELESSGLAGAQVSLYETGTNVLCAPRAEWKKVGCEEQLPGFDDNCPPSVPLAVPGASPVAYRPPLYLALDFWGELGKHRVADEVPAYDFQGASVVMRLALAMAGGAGAVGWHTHLANHGAHFVATGLREDLVDLTCMPEWLQARKSWYALRRLVSVAGACTGARLVWPELGGLDLVDFREAVRTGPTPSFLLNNFVVVIELLNATWPTVLSPRGRTGETGWRAYIAFIDPGAVREGKEVRTPAVARVTFQAPHSRTEPTVYRVPLEPADTVVVGTSTGGYPAQTWGPGEAERVDVHEIPGLGPGYEFTLDLGLGQWPVLVLTPTEFTVSVADGDVVARDDDDG